MPKRQGYVDFNFGGLNTKSPPTSLRPGETPNCQNVDGYIAGGLRKKGGTAYVGSDSFTANATILAIHQHRNQDWSEKVEIAAVWDDDVGNNEIRFWWNNAGTWTVIANANVPSDWHTGAAIPETDRIRFFTYNSLHTYAFNADDANSLGYNLVYDHLSGSPKMRKMGIDLPGYTPTYTHTGTGLTLTSGRSHRVGFLNSVTGYRGNADAADAPTGTGALTNQDITLNSLPTTAEPGIDKKEIWASEDASQAGGPWYLVGTVALATTSFTYSDSDAIIRQKEVLVETNTVPPPLLNACLARGRMFAIEVVSGKASNKVWYSQLGLPESMPATNWFRMPEPITAICEHRGLLYLFSLHNVWRMDVRDTEPAAWSADELGAWGCVGDRCVLTDVKDVLVYLSERGLTVLDSTVSGNLSQKIEGDIGRYGTTITTGKEWILTHDRNRHQVIVVQNPLTGGLNNQIFYFDYEQVSFWKGVIPSVLSEIKDMVWEIDSDDRTKVIFADGQGTPRIHRFDDSANWADGSAVDAYWETKWLDLDAPGNDKSLLWLELEFQVETTGTLDVLIYKDRVDTQVAHALKVKLKNPDGYEKIALGHIGPSAWFKVRFANARAGEAFLIYRWGLKWELLDARGN